MDNKAFQELRLKQMEAAKEYQPFRELLRKKALYKDLKNHPGYKVLEEYLRAVLSQFEEALVTGYQNSDKQDISGIFRGRILAVKEVLDLEKAMDAYQELKDIVAGLNKDQPKVPQGGIELMEKGAL